MIVANGGPRTTEGSLMESSNVLEIVRQDMVYVICKLNSLKNLIAV
jgi:hypothetical protein